MKKSKTTKRALLTSALSMLVCLAMLIGSTFAWFTDSVTSGRNQIVAGNLDVELYHGKESVPTTPVEAATDLFTDVNGEPILWEPGVMVYENFTVRNVGTLALKYHLKLNVTAFNTVEGTEKSLKDVLKVAVLDRAFEGAREEVKALTFGQTIEQFEKTDTLLPGDPDQVYAIVVYWEPSDVDNDYNLKNGLTSSDGNPLYIDLGINLVATQTPHEEDSFGPDYDTGAWDVQAQAQRLEALKAEGYTPVEAAADLRTLTEAATDEPVKLVMADNLQTDILVGGRRPNVEIKGNAVIDFNGNEVVRTSGNGNALLVRSPEADVTLRNANFVSATGSTTLRVEDVSNLTIEDTNFTCQSAGSTGNQMVQFYASETNQPMTVVFKNCTFDKGYIAVDGYVSNFNFQFENCKFVWNDRNGSSFVQAGYYSPGVYTFNNCQFEYNNWWSGALIRTSAYNYSTTVNLNNITVVGSSGSNNRQPKVVGTNTSGSGRNTFITQSGTNTYTYDGAPLDWDSVLKEANIP